MPTLVLCFFGTFDDLMTSNALAERELDSESVSDFFKRELNSGFIIPSGMLE